MNEDRRQHLQFVQNAIAQMDNKSAQVKTWTVTLFAAVLAFSASSKNLKYALIAVIPILIFWLLDSHYLQQSYKYRRLYDDIVAGKVPSFTMAVEKYKDGTCCFCRAILDPTTLLVYPLLIACAFIIG